MPEGIIVPRELRIFFTSVPFPHARSQISASKVLSDPECASRRLGVGQSLTLLA